jgi:hypothetical protein
MVCTIYSSSSLGATACGCTQLAQHAQASQARVCPKGGCSNNEFVTHHWLAEGGLQAGIHVWLRLLLPCCRIRHTALAAAGRGAVLLLAGVLLLTAPLLHSLLLQLLRRFQQQALHLPCWLHLQLLSVLPAIDSHCHCHIAGCVCQGVTVALVEEQQLASSTCFQPAEQHSPASCCVARCWTNHASCDGDCSSGAPNTVGVVI